MMVILRCFAFVSTLVLWCNTGSCMAFQPTKYSTKSTISNHHFSLQSPPPTTRETINLYALSNRKQSNSVSKDVATAAASMALSLMVLFNTNIQPVMASDRAAQVSLDVIPPSSISIQIQDLPVIGNVISGVYTKVPAADGSKTSKPSIVIKSPVDKVGAIANIAKGGHLEFDVTGKIKTHLDVDVAADEAGTLKVLVQSPLIPKLPFKNMASTAFSTSPIVGGKESAWNIVTNLGTGESYYYNAKTGVTQTMRPDRI